MFLYMQDIFPALTENNPGLWAKISSFSPYQVSRAVTASSSALLSSAGSSTNGFLPLQLDRPQNTL